MEVEKNYVIFFFLCRVSESVICVVVIVVEKKKSDYYTTQLWGKGVWRYTQSSKQQRQKKMVLRLVGFGSFELFGGL